MIGIHTAPSLPAAQELKRGGVRMWLCLVAFTMRNWFFGWIFFLPSFFLSLVNMVTGAVIFYLMGQLVARGAEPYMADYGVSYGSYIVLGVMFNMVMETTMNAYHQSLLRGYWATQFDVYLQHPGGVSALLTGDILMRYLLSALTTLIYFAVGVQWFGIAFTVHNLPAVVFILMMAVLALTGLGLAGASTFTLLNAKNWDANPVAWLVGFGVALLAGVYFPPEVLPAWLQRIGDLLPQTHALHAGRLCLSGKASLSDPAIQAHLLYLARFSLVALPVGLALFLAGIRKAQRDGTLTRWS